MFKIVERLEKKLFDEWVSSYSILTIQFGLGLMIILDRVIIYRDFNNFYGLGGISPLRPEKQAYSLFNFFKVLPISQEILWTMNGLVILLSVCLIFGFGGRVVVFILLGILNSFIFREPYANYIADTSLINLLFIFVLVGPIAWKNRTSFVRAKNLLIFQIFVCSLYLANGCAKLFGNEWRNGNAVYLVKQMRVVWDHSFNVFPMENILFTKILTYSVLIFEVLGPFFLLFGKGKWRYLALLAAVLFHLSLHLQMSLAHAHFTFIIMLTAFLPWKTNQGKAIE